MASGGTAGKAQREIQRLCLDGLDAWALRTQALRRIQALVPFDCAWWATADPATLLLTGGVSEGVPEKATPLFLVNEMLGEDVNKFSGLAQGASTVSTLFAATQGRPERSPRFREILHPFGMGDEMRIALREGGLTWGFICMHRTLSATPFSAAEMALLGGLGPHLAGGLRNALLLECKTSGPGHETPGVVTLSDDLAIVHTTPNAEVWLDEMADWPAGAAPAQAVSSVAARLLAQERGEGPGPLASPRVRIRTRAGRWLTLHALRLSSPEHGGQIAVVIEPARPEEMAPLLLSAYALTERERGIAQYVLRGMSNKAIGRALSVSPLTVQQHLKAVFEKMGVHSRGEMTGRVLVEYHRERAPGAGDAKPGNAKSAVAMPARG
jgi:DNA-binding CsgD family transcriptional regulator